MKKLALFVLSIFLFISATAETPGYSSRMINSQGAGYAFSNWDYVPGLVIKTMLMYCKQYPEDELSTRAYNWCKSYADRAIDDKGNFYNFKEGSLDNIASGKVLLDLYAMESTRNPTDSERYRKAAEYLYIYLRYHYPRIQRSEGENCFIHKTSYPDQMWLDGLYMGSAFYAEYVSMFLPDDNEAWEDITLQFTTIHEHTYDTEKGLNYHAWSANPEDDNSFWARRSEPNKGCSQEFWGRGMGWYAAALVDVLEVMPREHPGYAKLSEIFKQVADGICRWQDATSGVWYQLLQYDNSFRSAGGNPNYLEASASNMFTYALLKGMKLGVLDIKEYCSAATRAYEGLISTFITTNNQGGIDINDICRSAGLGPSSDRERDGTANYYLDGRDVTRVANEGKGIGSFIMASLEYEKYLTTSIESVRADESSQTMYYDLHGRRYQSEPKGLYIELKDGVASKMINK